MVHRLRVIFLFGCFAAVNGAGVAAEQNDMRLPPDFVMDVFADVPGARSLAVGDGGTVFVAGGSTGAVYAVIREDDDQQRVVKVASGLNWPNGIAFHDGDLYVAEISRVTRYRDIEASLADVPVAEVLDIELPSKTHHGRRYIDFGPDGKLYISIGAPCNVCEDAGFGEIIRMNPDGSGRETFAEGIRNSVGFSWHPLTSELWFTDNGRDELGDDRPPDELNRARKTGLHFGFPYCHGGDIPDPDYGQGHDCDHYTAPAQKLGPHVAALGIAFYTGGMFPADYREQLFIAEHGSWNRTEKSGHRVTLVRFDNGRPVSYETFADGWLREEDGSVTGRPVDLLVLDDGSMLVSDDYAGKVYRIRYVGVPR